MSESRNRVLTAALAVAGAVGGLACAALAHAGSAAAINPCQGDFPPASCHRPAPPPPRVATPANAAVSGVTGTSATLSWTDTSQDETGFLVTRYLHTTTNAPWQVNTFSVAAPAGVTSFSLPQTGLPTQETVQWDIQATRAGKATSYGAVTGTMTVDLSGATSAVAQLQAFRADWQSTAFPNVNKAAVLANAAHIVAATAGVGGTRVSAIDQAQTGLCGPATVEYRLVSTDPGRFVDIVRSIADNGAFTTADGTTYAAHPELRASAPNPTVQPANWLFMATLEDAYNLVRITGSTGGNDVAWISSPADVDNWLSHVDGLHTTTATAILRPFTSGETVMPGANAVLQAGGAVVLLVDSSLVGNPAGALSEPNHWVNLLSWSSTSSSVTFTVATWGQTLTLTKSWSAFDGLTWDVLTAR